MSVVGFLPKLMFGDKPTLSSSLRSIVDGKETLIKKINDEINKISSENKNFQIDFIDIEQPYQSAFIAKNESKKILLPDNLGSGFNILIAYALFSYVANKEKIPIILLIDEPELHLHSDWQKKMYNRFIEQDNLQIVYSTQSENFISLKNWQQIRLVKDYSIFPKQDEDQPRMQAIDGENDTSAQFLDDYADKNLHISLILRENLELFFTKKCILVEGPGEKYALPKLLSLDGCNIDDYSVSIIPVWGKTKLKIYQIICKHYGIDYYSIFDQDTEDDNQENTLIESNAQIEKITKFSTSFENKLEVGSDNKFQKLVKKIDELKSIDSLDEEIKNCVSNLSNFIKND